MNRKLFLIPNVLSSSQRGEEYHPKANRDAIKSLRTFFVEDPKSARALLRLMDPQFPLSACTFFDLNEHTSLSQIKDDLSRAEQIGGSMAIISEAGYPCVADPGAELVRLAHERAIDIVPLWGASSIFLALAASGLNGQNFAFNGYLPKDRQERLGKIKQLEERSRKEGQTQILMETPYRSQSLLDDLLEACHPKTLICVASHLTADDQWIKTAMVSQWKKHPVVLEKRPTLFLLLYFY